MLWVSKHFHYSFQLFLNWANLNICAFIRIARKMSNAFRLFTSIDLTANLVRADWVQTDGPEGGRINCFAVSGSNRYSGT